MKTPRFTTPVAFLALALRANALIFTGGTNHIDDPGWPAGALPAANLPSRIFWAEGPPFGGGEWTFFHTGDTAALQKCIDAFAGIESPVHDIRVHPGHPNIPYSTRDAAGEPIGYDWSFTVWKADTFEKLLGPKGAPFMSRHPDFGATNAPLRFDVWVHAGGADWDAIKVPKNARIVDGRAEKHGFPSDQLTLQVHFLPAAGRPVEHGRVELVHQGTDSPNGGPGPAANAVGDTATVTGIPTGPYQIVASAPDFVARVVGETTADGDTYRELSVALDPESLVAGIAVDRDGKGIPGVEIHAGEVIGSDGHGYAMPAAPGATTGDDGHFVLRGLPSSRVQLRAAKTGFHQVWESSGIIQLPSTDLTIRMVPTGSVRVSVGVGGTVHIQEAARRGVGSWGGSGNADPEGWVEFKDVPVGEYFVSPTPFPEDKLSGTKLVIEPGRAVEAKVTKP